jgi:two-component system nitrate/nitrite response regulator NarL
MVRVLLVDDHPAFLSMIEAELIALCQLTIVGYAQSGREALEQVRRLQPDLVLLDIAMPDINGFEVAYRIKAQPRPIAVVLVSLHDTPVYHSASASIADGFVPKDALDIHLAPLIDRLFPCDDREAGVP